MGTTEWSWSDLQDWLSLASLLKNGTKAAFELNRVMTEKSYCIPGISLRSCDSLRDSRQTTNDAVVAAYQELKGTANFESKIFSATIQRTRSLHLQRQQVRFALSRHNDEMPLGHFEGTALTILKVLARETLVRHLPYDLSPDTRLAIAAVPLIAPLAPFLSVVPIELSEFFVIGDQMNGVGLLEMNWPGDSLVKLYVNLDLDEKPMNALEAHLSAPETYSLGQMETLALSAEKRLNEIAARFKDEMKLKANIQVNAKADDHEELRVSSVDLNVKGLGRLQQILFYYYVWEQLQ